MKQISNFVDKDELNLLKKFVLNGFFATFIHYFTLTFFSSFIFSNSPNPYGWSYAVGSLFGITSSFFGNKFYVFKSTIKKKSSTNQFIRFISIYFILMMICSTFMSILSDYFLIDYNISFIVIIGLQTILNYMLLKKYVF